MNYHIQHDGGSHFYPTQKGLIGFSKLKFPVYPYENDTHNENTRNDQPLFGNFKLIHICPQFRDRNRLMYVLDRYFIADKICKSSQLPIQTVLYCKPIDYSAKSFDDGDYYQPSYASSNPERILWNAAGWWEVNFIWNCLPKNWDYQSGYFTNRFETFESAITEISKYISKSK